MSFLVDLTEGVARQLAAAGIGLTWRQTGQYETGEVGIFIAAVPPVPDKLVTLTPYPLGDDPTLRDSEIGMQVRSRSATPDPRDVMALDDAIADYLLGFYPLTLPTGVRVTRLQRSSSTPLGQEVDGAKRWSWASSYVLGVYRPTLHRV